MYQPDSSTIGGVVSITRGRNRWQRGLSVLCLDDEWASRTIPNPGSGGHGEDNKEAEYDIAYRLHEELLVVLHITRSGNRGHRR